MIAHFRIPVDGDPITCEKVDWWTNHNRGAEERRWCRWMIGGPLTSVALGKRLATANVRALVSGAANIFLLLLTLFHTRKQIGRYRSMLKRDNLRDNWAEEKSTAFFIIMLLLKCTGGIKHHSSILANANRFNFKPLNLSKAATAPLPTPVWYWKMDQVVFALFPVFF